MEVSLCAGPLGQSVWYDLCPELPHVRPIHVPHGRQGQGHPVEAVRLIHVINRLHKVCVRVMEIIHVSRVIPVIPVVEPKVQYMGAINGCT